MPTECTGQSGEASALRGLQTIFGILASATICRRGTGSVRSTVGTEDLRGNQQDQRNDVGEQNMEENMEEKRLRFYNTQTSGGELLHRAVRSEEVALTAVGCLWFCGIT